MPPKRKQPGSSSFSSRAKKPCFALSVPTVPAQSEIPEHVHLQNLYGGKKAKLALHLPPLHDLGEIYRCITRHAMETGLGKFLEHIRGKALRVATVCSGTESPLLALEMVRKWLVEVFDEDFALVHKFSAEIVAMKQAYIARNFKPDILFRDVTQLKDPMAQTAYGAWKPVPRDVDLLVAGFACVDFSVLNCKRKKLDDNGESGGTFMAIVDYVKVARPQMIILENVKNCPWDELVKRWNDIGYLAVHADVDTKDFYIPQTRVRGYMLCVDKQGLDPDLEKSVMGDWVALLSRFKRRASSPAGMFLLDDDDPQLEKIETDLATRILSHGPRVPACWKKYQKHHNAHRDHNKLGHRRPVTNSEDHVTCKMPDFAWHTWAGSAVERVWDTLDINFLRKLQIGVDINYKERYLDLSQGIEREVDNRGYGIIGCATPMGAPYCTTRGGPISGRESLHLQGLPTDRMLLTRETPRELQDLAGNAMTSTVVGSATLAALIAGYKAFDINNMPLATTSDEVEDIEPMTKYDLIQNDIHLGKADVNTAQLQALGARSARYCPCERQSRTKQKILRCVECGHTACSDCAGNPMHKFRSADLQRSDPLHFITLLKSILPPRLVFSGLSEADYEPLKLNEIGWSPDTWTEFLKSVMKAVGDELRLYEIKRSEAWTVVYNGRSSVLKLVIDTIVAWQLFAKPDDSAPVLSLARVILEKPIARMIPSGSILNGVWVVCTPLSSKREMTIHGAGTKGPSFEQMCGLKNPEHKDSKVWSELVVQGPDTTNDFDTDIRGEYTRLPYCGMAKGTLHKKAATADAPAVYLFLDPTKYGHQEGDMFVFSTDHRRITGHDPRLTIGEVSNKWVYPKATLEPQPVNIFHRSWAKVQTATMDIFAPDTSISRQTLKPGTRMSVGEDECRHANATITTFSIPETRMESSWQDGPWELIDSANTVSMPELFWLASKAADFPDFQHWNPVDIFEASRECGPCAECAPPKPGIMWDCKETCSKPYENPEEAALYERRVKAKPSPFLVYRRMEDGLARFAVSLNIQTLLHQAHARLGGGLSANASYSWRLVPDAYDPKPLLPKFQLIGNKETAPALPSRFKLSLRPEQQRSLSWMISQEADIPPFVEEETEEAFLPLTMWRAECRVTAPKHVRGGIIADEVGYGKTAIVLALIATQSVEEPKRVDGFIPSKATLLIVPGVLVSQWHSEIVRFMDIEPKDVLILQDVAAVAKTRIADIREAKIILVPSIMFTGQAYPNRMSEFTGMPQAPTKGGRNFDRWFRDAQGSLNELANVLMNRGPSELLAAIHAKREAAAFKNTEFIYEPSKRLRGKAYEEAHQNPGPKDGGVSSKSSKGRTPKSQGQRQVEFNISTTHQNKVDDVQIPVLHAFSFNRLVIDEFTYADSEKLGLFFALQARSKWIISGTPPLNDFAGVNTISPFLGVHLGIADDELNLTARRQKSELGVEKLQAFKERHSGAWHLNRHQIAQRFLDRFARRNIAEIGEIPSTEHVVLVSQSPAETALYLELVARLMTQRDQYRRLGKIRNDDDRLSRLREMIEPSTAPKEALVRRGSSSVLEDRWKDKKPESITIGSLIGIRKAEIGRLQELFGKTMAQASWIHTHKDVDGEAYKNLIEDVYHNLFGNRTLRVNVFETVKESVRVSTVSGLQGNGWKENADPKEIGESGGPLMNFLAEYQETQSETSGEATSSRQFEYDGDSSEDEAESKDGKEPESPAEFAAANKRICGKLRRMMRRWVSQVGALRFLESFQHVQLTAAIPKCDSCGSRPAALDKTNILGSCGHILCEACMLKATDSETCAVKECTASGKESEVVSGQEISQREDQAAKYGGSKMEKLVEIIQSTPENERVLLFIQFPEIVNVASKVLDLAGIKYKTITSDSHELFQQTGKPLAKLHKLKVLILKVGTETAAGLNLQHANHVVFLSPVVCETQYDYESSMSQAIGRARRYGQSKHVHIYHLLAKKTVDVNIYQERRGKVLVERDGEGVLVESASIEERMSCQGRVIDEY